MARVKWSTLLAQRVLGYHEAAELQENLDLVDAVQPTLDLGSGRELTRPLRAPASLLGGYYLSRGDGTPSRPYAFVYITARASDDVPQDPSDGLDIDWLQFWSNATHGDTGALRGWIVDSISDALTDWNVESAGDPSAFAIEGPGATCRYGGGSAANYDDNPYEYSLMLQPAASNNARSMPVEIRDVHIPAEKTLVLWSDQTGGEPTPGERRYVGFTARVRNRAL